MTTSKAAPAPNRGGPHPEPSHSHLEPPMPETTNPQTDDLAARLEAVLTERFTELGNPFAEMRRHEKGPDGWPASHPVGPHQVAEVLRELLAAAPAAAPSAPADRAAILREAAERVTGYAADHFPDEYDEYADQLADELRRLADEPASGPSRVAGEAPQPETPVHGESVAHLAGVAGEAPQPETRKACGCGQDGCEYCDVDDDADEERQPETQAEAHPPTVTWEIESPRRGTWASWGTTYDEHDWARERFQDAVGHVPARQFRLVRATTVYIVEAEQPAAVSQPAKEA